MVRIFLFIAGLFFTIGAMADSSLHELRKKAVCHAGWIAGNTQGHQQWAAIRRQAERMKNYDKKASKQHQQSGQQHQAKQPSAKQVRQAKAYHRTYSECFKRGKQQPYNRQKIKNKVNQLQYLSKRLEAKK